MQVTGSDTFRRGVISVGGDGLGFTRHSRLRRIFKYAWRRLGGTMIRSKSTIRSRRKWKVGGSTRIRKVTVMGDMDSGDASGTPLWRGSSTRRKWGRGGGGELEPLDGG